MVPVVFQVCDDADATLGVELSIRVEWRDAPVLGEFVSMGGEDRWEVIEVNVFKSAEVGRVEAIYVAHLHLAGQGKPDPWTIYSFQEDYPEQLFHIELAAVGEPQLSCGINVIGRKNRIGEQLQSHVPTSHPTLLQAVPIPWQIDSIEVYLPEGKTPYKSVHLCWCVAIKEAVAVA